MFTGIVEERGTVVSPAPRLEVLAARVGDDSPPGASVSVSGVCLTVVERRPALEGQPGVVLAFDVSAETSARSSLGGLRAGDGVNLERPVTLATRLGGHLVQGHVDGVGTIASVERAHGGTTMTIDLPPGLGRYVVEKGSLALDGVSLTAAGVRDDRCRVALVPHTLAVTTLGTAAVGDAVNVEVDVLAKHLERLVAASSTAGGTR